MPAGRTRHWIAAGTAAPLLLALVLAVAVARHAVRRVDRALLHGETGIAAELVRLSRRPAILDELFPRRWHVTPNVDSLLAETELAGTDTGLVGRATVYDQDSWYPVGTVELAQHVERGPVPGATWVVVSGLAALLLVALALWWSEDRGASVLLPLGAAAALALSLGLLAREARARLREATAERMDVAARALRLVPDSAAILAQPGAVLQLTGAGYVVASTGAAVRATSLTPALADSLVRRNVGATNRVTIDHTTYAVRQVGAVVLTALPYEQTDDPTTAMVAIALVALALGTAVSSLARLVRRPRRLRRELTAWSFLSPAVIHLSVFTVGPLLFAALLSFHRWSLIDAARPFVGLENYLAVLRDAAWWNAIRNSAVFTLNVPFAMAIALGLALLLQRELRGITWLRALFFLPTITSLVAIAIAWQWMLNDQYGLINWVLSLVGLGPIPWLTSPGTALLAIMIMSVWMTLGYQMVLFQAGLAAIPQELYDAARIDGAGPWRRVVHVTLPGLRHTLFFVLVTSIIGSFQIFGAVYVMTEGGPLHATDVAVFHIYEEAWEFFRFGRAAAMSWILFAIIFAVTLLQFRVLERRVEEA